MRTVVISDLHLGGSIGVDILRRPENREPLKELITGCDRLVLLGDTLELRHGPSHQALDVALPALADIASVLTPGTEVVLVAGNHDHALVEPWLEARRSHGAPQPLGLEEPVTIESGSIAARIVDAMKPGDVVLSHPGVWIREDIYAFHGNYLDRHIDVPTFERMAAGVMERITGRRAADATGADDYEAVLGPLYAWSYELAQWPRERSGLGPGGFSQRAWQVLSGSGHRPVRKRLLGLGFAGAVGVLNLARIGPLSAELSPARLRRAGIESAAAAARGIGVEAPHVIYGHTHRPGPLEGDLISEWRQQGVNLWNTGSWVFEEHFLAGASRGSAYWPGRAIEVRDEGEPIVHSLLSDRSAEEILGRMHPTDEHS